MQNIDSVTGKFEAIIETVASPIKPYLPVLARFLLVVTFLEDSVRIISQWGDQVNYLHRHQGETGLSSDPTYFGFRLGFPWGLAEIFLSINVSVMLAGSTLAILKKHTQIAVAGLGGVIISQWIGYGLLFDGNFFLRNLSVAGGLLMLLADAYSGNKKKLFAGLPSINETDRATYLQLFGRILLVFLFLTFVFSGEFSVLRLVVSLVGMAGCVMVVIGFKAKYTAWFLIALLCISNVVLNNWWSLHHAHPRRDFLKYDFFQTLSIMGGFLLLANLGAGGISVDEKKKNF